MINLYVKYLLKTLEEVFSPEIKTMFRKTKYEYSKQIHYSVIHEGRKGSIIH